MKFVRIPIWISLIVGYLFGWTSLGMVIVGLILWRAYKVITLKKECVRVPSITNEPMLYMSAVELAEKIKKREIKSEELVEIFIKQIQRVNPTINALVRTRFDEARLEAKEADLRTQFSQNTNELPKLHGVPCTIKESFGIIGMPNSSGLLSRKDHISSHDATVIRRLKKEGAIILGVTNVSELCMWMESSNLVYGQTNNPYDSRRTVGGSSGGEGASQAACCSAFGMGSDIGGSIRMPAFFNGIFGHKPSGGLVPCTGQYPISKNEALRYMTTGPMCRKAKDLMPLLKIIGGPDGHDTGCLECELGNPSDVDIKKLKFYSIHSGPSRLFYKRVSKSMNDSQKNVEKYLQSIGAQVEIIPYLPEFEHTFEMWSNCLTVANDKFAFLMGSEKEEISVMWELFRWLVDVPNHTFPAIGLAILEQFSKFFSEKNNVKKQEVKKLLENKLGTNGVILMPSYPVEAPRHARALFPPLNFVYTAIFNILEFPVTQVPLGLSKNGLPLGIQVASMHGNDHITIAVAIELEKAFGGWVAPGN